MYKVVPGYKGVVVGDRKDMIERTVRQSIHRLHTKKHWDSHSMSSVTRYYLPSGKLYNPMTDGHLLIEKNPK